MLKVELVGEKAIVTGSSTGIGRATAVALAQAGADVVIHYVDNRNEAETTAAFVRASGRQARIIAGDFAKAGEAARVVKEAAESLGGEVHILINNAGSMLRRVAIDDLTTEMWNESIELNLNSVFHATQAVLPFMKPGGRIVNVASLAARNGGGPQAFAYVASKGGVIALTRALCKELASKGIRVNCISPGTILTPFQEHFGSPARLEATREELPLKRLGTAEECANLILFLASPQSSFINGEDVQINGGQHYS